MSKLSALVMFILIVVCPDARSQELGPIPDVDVVNIDMDDIYGMVGEDDVWGVIDLSTPLEGFEDAELPMPRLSELFNKEKKHVRMSVKETAGWMMNFVLSGRLSRYMDKAHHLFILLSDEEKELHEKFFSSYVTVSEDVISSDKVMKILLMMNTTLERVDGMKLLLGQHRNSFSDGEYLYFISALNTILTIMTDTIVDFNTLTTDGVLVATEGQRMSLLDRVIAGAEKVDKGLNSLALQSKNILLSRSAEQETLRSLRLIYGLDEN